MAFNSYENVETIMSEDIPPLIIMHGLFGSKSNWNTIAKTIHNSLKRKVVAVDARNHGESPHAKDFSYRHLAADLRLLLNELEIKKACLLGHSMGGRAVMTFGLLYPELVDKMVVVDISPIDTSLGMVNMKIYFDALLSVKFAENITLSQARKSANEQLMQWIPDNAIRQFLLTNLTQRDGGQFKWRVNIESLSKVFQSQIMTFPCLSSTCYNPILFIGGLRSDYLRMDDHGAIRQLFPNADFHYLDAGHWVHAERPEEFISIVCNFITNDTRRV
ncbi:hypothetical protein AAG570_008014 [Ranatra chinensis]|uniref:sn-1-specific diacylglycerol lipase ABHD11 n=1 Tax=Ranatra chinensis TaxID=642074 RepID=A0ABD0XTI8_9HEMI